VSWEALLRFAPAYDARHFVDDAADAPELVVSHDALKKPKRNEPTPVVIDHDLERIVGHVQHVWVAEDVDYGTRARWHFAACELDEKPDCLNAAAACPGRTTRCTSTSSRCRPEPRRRSSHPASSARSRC
jgi:hypothetical protein